MNLFDTHKTEARLVDILQLIPMGEKVRVRGIDTIACPTAATGTPEEIASKKEEWLRCEVLSVTREFSETGLIQIDVMKD